MLLEYELSYDKVFSFTVASHRAWLSRQKDQLRICQNTKYDNQGAQNFIMPETFSKRVERAHQCQTRIVPVAGVLCSLSGVLQ